MAVLSKGCSPDVISQAVKSEKFEEITDLKAVAVFKTEESDYAIDLNGVKSLDDHANSMKGMVNTIKDGDRMEEESVQAKDEIEYEDHYDVKEWKEFKYEASTIKEGKYEEFHYSKELKEIKQEASSIEDEKRLEDCFGVKSEEVDDTKMEDFKEKMKEEIKNEIEDVKAKVKYEPREEPQGWRRIHKCKHKNVRGAN